MVLISVQHRGPLAGKPHIAAVCQRAHCSHTCRALVPRLVGIGVARVMLTNMDGSHCDELACKGHYGQILVGEAEYDVEENGRTYRGIWTPSRYFLLN
jgi:hypothetical protein